MNIIKNRPELKNLRKKLRQQSTTPEQILWYRLRGGSLQGYKFRRQYSVGEYILDFYCINLKLAIEADGDSHYTLEQKKYDNNRTEYLNKFGIKVLRFTNLDIMTNLEGVIDLIVQHLP